MMNRTLALLMLAALPAWAGAADKADKPDADKPASIIPAGDRTDIAPAVAGASRLVTFRWTDRASFIIRALQDTFVNLELPEGETVEGLYLSDAQSWSYHVTGDNRRVLIKPAAPGLTNTGTLVSSKRSYELTLISVAPGEPWYQRVRWEIPGTNPAADGLYWRSQPVQASGGAAGSTLDPTRLHFGYQVKGNAPFAPVVVFDDGVRTWFRFNAQDWPALFAVRDGGLEVLDVAREGDYLIVPTLADRFVLRLRKQQIEVLRK